VPVELSSGADGVAPLSCVQPENVSVVSARL
jgi:hypothetical protein